jgi:hypothetical protein
MGGIFTEWYLFLGGDELSEKYFTDNPTIAKWMSDRGLNSSST